MFFKRFRTIPGHREDDLTAGSRNSFIDTLVARRTRYVMLAKVSGKETQTVVAALAQQVRHLPGELRLSLTLDRGEERADHKRLTLATDLSVHTREHIDPVAWEFKQRPGMTLNYVSPVEKFQECVAAVA